MACTVVSDWQDPHMSEEQKYKLLYFLRFSCTFVKELTKSRQPSKGKFCFFFKINK